MDVRCKCGRKLAEIIAGVVVSRHHGRVYGAPAAIACERCGKVWEATKATESKDVEQSKPAST